MTIKNTSLLLLFIFTFTFSSSAISNNLILLKDSALQEVYVIGRYVDDWIGSYYKKKGKFPKALEKQKDGPCKDCFSGYFDDFKDERWIKSGHTYKVNYDGNKATLQYNPATGVFFLKYYSLKNYKTKMGNFEINIDGIEATLVEPKER